MYTASSADLPFMTDAEVTTYYQARETDEAKRTETQSRAVRQWELQPNLMALADLMEKLKAGGKMSEELDEKLEELCILAEFEATAS